MFPGAQGASACSVSERSGVWSLAQQPDACSTAVPQSPTQGRPRGTTGTPRNPGHVPLASSGSPVVPKPAVTLQSGQSSRGLVAAQRKGLDHSVYSQWSHRFVDIAAFPLTSASIEMD